VSHAGTRSGAAASTEVRRPELNRLGPSSFFCTRLSSLTSFFRVPLLLEVVIQFRCASDSMV
jgi:hypothetical protein